MKVSGQSGAGAAQGAGAASEITKFIRYKDFGSHRALQKHQLKQSLHQLEHKLTDLKGWSSAAKNERMKLAAEKQRLEAMLAKLG